MYTFAFIGRQGPTDSQIKLAKEKNIELIYIGDHNPFKVDIYCIQRKGDFHGVVVSHPAAAMRLSSYLPVGVFEHKFKLSMYERPNFEAISFHVYT